MCAWWGGRLDYPLRVFSAIVERNNAIKMWLWNLYLIWAAGFFFLLFHALRFLLSLISLRCVSNEWEKKLSFLLPDGCAREISIRFVCLSVNANYSAPLCRCDAMIDASIPTPFGRNFIIHTIAITVKCQILKALPSLNVSKPIIPFNSNRREMRFRYKSNLLYAHTLHLFAFLNFHD